MNSSEKGPAEGETTDKSPNPALVDGQGDSGQLEERRDAESSEGGSITESGASANEDAKNPRKSEKGAPGATPLGWRGAPGWVVPLYVVGLVLIFAGQRALSALEAGATVLTALGVMGVLVSSFARFSPKFAARGEAGSIEALMRGLSLLGLFALALYAATTEWGQDTLGITNMDLESRERVLGVLEVSWLSLLLVATLPMLFAEASLRPMRRADRPESRRVKAAATAGLALALAAVYGSLFVFSAKAADIKADYSYFKTSGPSESTKKIAQSLQDQVKVTAFFPEVNQVKSEVLGYLNELGKSAPKLKVEMTDRLLVPKKARELHATQDGMVVLSKGKVTRSVIVGTELESARAKLKTLDQDFQSQLLKLARSRRNVYMTVGHGELNDKSQKNTEGRSAQILDALLRKQNYTVKDLGLAQGLGNQVPEDADVVMVLGPSEPFAPEEVATLERYVKAGGKLLLALDPDAISTSDTVRSVEVEAGDQQGERDLPKSAEPAKQQTLDSKGPQDTEAAQGFGKLLSSIGLTFSPTILANENRHVRRRYNDSDRVMLVTSNFSSHASVSTLSRNAPRAAIVLSGAGSLDAVQKVATKRDNQIDFTVRAAPDTFADVNRDYRREKDSEPAKSYNLAAAVSKKLGKKKQQDDKPADTKKQKDDKGDSADNLDEYRVFVIGDADALSDLVLANVPGNQFLFVDAVRWLGGEESWAGEQTTEEDVRIEHTKKEDQVWFYSTIFGAPALVLGAGVLISRRSRRRRERKGAQRKGAKA